MTQHAYRVTGGSYYARMAVREPTGILDTFFAFWRTDALNAALDLGLFTAMEGKRRTARRLGQACGAKAADVRSLCDYLASLGLVHKRRDSYWASAEAARFLDARSPDSLAAIPHFLRASHVTKALSGLAGTMRGHGRHRHAGASRVSTVIHWEYFARATLPIRRLQARPLADELERRGLVRGKILDIGAGGSPLGVELLRRRPGTSLVVQDARQVVRMAREHAVRTGVGRRVTTLIGDARTVDFGGPFDLVLMTNFLDYFNVPTRAALVRKAYAALGAGGALALSAPFLRANRTSPPDAAAYGLLLLAVGAGGQPSTVREWAGLLRRARFSPVVRCADLPLVVGRKP